MQWLRFMGFYGNGIFYDGYVIQNVGWGQALVLPYKAQSALMNDYLATDCNQSDEREGLQTWTNRGINVKNCLNCNITEEIL